MKKSAKRQRRQQKAAARRKRRTRRVARDSRPVPGTGRSRARRRELPALRERPYSQTDFGLAASISALAVPLIAARSRRHRSQSDA